MVNFNNEPSGGEPQDETNEVINRIYSEMNINPQNALKLLNKHLIKVVLPAPKKPEKISILVIIPTSCISYQNHLFFHTYL